MLDLANQTYIAGMYTYKRGTDSITCVEDFPPGDIPPTGTIGECKYQRYLQVAAFKKTIDDGNKYFMVVNRRCSPYINDQSEDNNGGRRIIKAVFSITIMILTFYNSWDVYDVANPLAPPVGRYTVTSGQPVQLGDWSCRAKPDYL
jgi:hypothetical protein